MHVCGRAGREGAYLECRRVAASSWRCRRWSWRSAANGMAPAAAPLPCLEAAGPAARVSSTWRRRTTPPTYFSLLLDQWSIRNKMPPQVPQTNQCVFFLARRSQFTGVEVRRREWANGIGASLYINLEGAGERQITGICMI